MKKLEVFSFIFSNLGVNLFPDTTFKYEISIKNGMVRGYTKREGYELRYCFDLKKNNHSDEPKSPN